MRANWTLKLPGETGLFWWWNGDADSLPLPVNITYSGTSGTYFATAGQWGWEAARETSDMGGYWARLPEPARPDTAESSADEPLPSLGEIMDAAYEEFNATHPRVVEREDIADWVNRRRDFAARAVAAFAVERAEIRWAKERAELKALAMAVRVSGNLAGTKPRIGSNDPFEHMIGLALLLTTDGETGLHSVVTQWENVSSQLYKTLKDMRDYIHHANRTHPFLEDVKVPLEAYEALIKVHPLAEPYPARK